MIGVTEARGITLLGHSDLGGHGDGMQVLVNGNTAYVGHLGIYGTSIVDVSDPRRLELVGHLASPPGTHSHKVQVGNGLLLVNRERYKDSSEWKAGFLVYDLADPFHPRQIGEWRTEGAGVHRMWFTDESPLAYISATVPGFTDRILLIFDLTDPAHPTEIGRWWYPGMHAAGGETPSWDPTRRCVCHHAVVQGNRAYVGWWDMGMVILDVSDPTNPSLIAHLDWHDRAGGATHTVLPLGRWLAVADEAIAPAPEAREKRIRLIDAADEQHPHVHRVFPEPEDKDRLRVSGSRFGPHCLHENRPGTFQSSTRVYATYYSAGLRGYDITEDGDVLETSYIVPATAPGQQACQINDLVVHSDGLVLFTDRVAGGLYTALIDAVD